MGRVAVDAQICLLPPVTFQYTGFVCPDRRSVLVSPRRFLVLGSVGLGDPVFLELWVCNLLHMRCSYSICGLVGARLEGPDLRYLRLEGVVGCRLLLHCDIN